MLNAIVVGSGTGLVTWMLSTSRPDGLSVVVASETPIPRTYVPVVTILMVFVRYPVSRPNTVLLGFVACSELFESATMFTPLGEAPPRLSV